MAFAETMVVRNGEASSAKGWEQKVLAYYAYLSDLDDSQLEYALIETGREPGRVYFPTPGEIRLHAEKALLSHATAQGEEAWETVMAHMARWGCPALPQSRVVAGSIVTEDPPEFTPRTRRALAAAGGYNAVFHTPPEHLHFCRTRFLETWNRADGGRPLLGDRTAKQLLEDLQNQARPRKELRNV